MNSARLMLLAAGLLAAKDPAGLRPRGNPTDYPAHQAAGGVTVAAATGFPAAPFRWSADGTTFATDCAAVEIVWQTLLELTENVGPKPTLYLEFEI